MTKKTHSRVQPINETFYYKGKTNRQTFTEYVNKLAGSALILMTIAVSPAIAQDKYHDTRTITPKYHSGESVTLPCGNTLYCRLQKLMHLLERLEIEFYLDFKLDLKIKLKPEEVVRRLSQLEDKLLRHGKLAPVIKLELDTLKVMINKG